MTNSEKISQIVSGMAEFNSRAIGLLEEVTSNYPYAVRHEPIVKLTLKQEYESIISQYPELAYRSCFGARIEMKQGDILPISPSVCDKAFINGIEYIADYTFTGENTEIAVVFAFAGDFGLNLPSINLNVVDVFVKNGMGSLNINKNWYSIANDLTVTGDLDVSGVYCNNYYVDVYEIGRSNRLTVIPANMKSFKSTCRVFGFDLAFFNGRTLCTSIELPEVEDIVSNTNQLMIQSPTTDCTISIPKLKTIKCTANGKLIADFKDIILPDTLENVDKGAFSDISNLFDFTGGINANFTSDQWYIFKNNTTPIAPTTIIFPEGWRQTISLAKIGVRQEKSFFIDVFNKLADVQAVGTRTITIPTKIIVQLNETEIDIARNKGWTVQGA